jgi:hypothetical protein
LAGTLVKLLRESVKKTLKLTGATLGLPKKQDRHHHKCRNQNRQRKLPDIADKARRGHARMFGDCFHEQIWRVADVSQGSKKRWRPMKWKQGLEQKIHGGPLFLRRAHSLKRIASNVVIRVALYLSLITIANLGSGDVVPSVESRFVAVTESLIRYTALAFLAALLFTTMQRGMRRQIKAYNQWRRALIQTNRPNPGSTSTSRLLAPPARRPLGPARLPGNSGLAQRRKPRRQLTISPTPTSSPPKSSKI